MGTLYENIKFLCDQKGVKPAKMCADIGVSKGLITDLKMGRKKSIQIETAAKIAQYFNVSADYLLNRTNDPIDYDADGDALAEIPLTYVEAAGGDMKKARAIMLAAERDAQKEAYMRSNRPSRFSAKDAELAFALWGDAADDIDEKDLEDIRQFAAFIKEKKQGK